MSTFRFRTGGALTDESADMYIERQADRDARIHLRMMDYLLLVEPRQQGKTSLINHLMRSSALGDTVLAYADVTTLDRVTEAAWIQTLCTRILRQLGGLIPHEHYPTIPQNNANWREFLCEVAQCATRSSRRVTICLDEIGAVTFPGATEFFSVLRDVYNSRQAEPDLGHLSFVLAGAFHPRDLIKDDRISPFNIAQRVRLADFTLAQVCELVSKGDWSNDQVPALSERIHFWTEGQPYLTQLLCAYLGRDASSNDVDAGVERLRREDENHLPPILTRLQHNKPLSQYVNEINSGKRIRFYPREHSRQAQLELLGVLKADEEGYCRIRNRIYELALYPHDKPTSIFPTPVKKSNTSSSMKPTDQVGQIEATDQSGDPAAIRELLMAALDDEELNTLCFDHFPQVYADFGLGMSKGHKVLRLLDYCQRQGHLEKLLCQVHLLNPHQYERFAARQHMNSTQASVTPQDRQREPHQRRIDAVIPSSAALGETVDVLVQVRFPDSPLLGLEEWPSKHRPDRVDQEFDLIEIAFPRDPRTQRLAPSRLEIQVETLDFTVVGNDREILEIPPDRYSARLVFLLKAQRVGTCRVNVHVRGVDRVHLGSVPMQIPIGDKSETPTLTVTHLFLVVTVKGADQGTSQTQLGVIGGGNMNYERGLSALKRLAQKTDWYQDFVIHEAALYDNLRDERRYGPSEQTRRDRTRIVDQLNGLALQRLGVSFNDLCMEKQPAPREQQAEGPSEIIERLRRIEQKLDLGRAEDRQAAAQILDAIKAHEVSDSEVAQMVSELRTWTKTIEQTGLPLKPELQDALTALTEHSGSAYQYLQLALPIIPGILSYNVELGSQHQADLRAIWERIRGRFGKKQAKGDGKSTGSETLYGVGNRWAVLVGVNEYDDKANYGRLHVCGKDVHALRDQLLAGGFDPARIRLLTDDTAELPTRDNILVALKAIADATEPDDLLLFYYSGHGDEDAGESYLVARNGRRLVLSDTAVRISRVKEIMERAPARAKVIVLDACHSGADIGGKGPKPMSADFIRRIFEQAAGTAILASCMQGQLSYEWQAQERSVFTHFLLEALRGEADRDDKGFVTVQDANRHVVNGVKLWASQQNVSQTPTLESRVAGDIILARHAAPG